MICDMISLCLCMISGVSSCATVHCKRVSASELWLQHKLGPAIICLMHLNEVNKAGEITVHK